MFFQHQLLTLNDCQLNQYASPARAISLVKQRTPEPVLLLLNMFVGLRCMLYWQNFSFVLALLGVDIG
ncbi:MAG: hypothetical protein ACJAZ0_002522 [Halioglobus sp.]|jgi:hypothetical protein